MDTDMVEALAELSDGVQDAAQRIKTLEDVEDLEILASRLIGYTEELKTYCRILRSRKNR